MPSSGRDFAELKMLDIGCDLQLNEIGVSDRGTLRGLTQFPRTAFLVHVKPLNANEIANGSEIAGVCDNLIQTARKLLILKTE